MRDHSIYILYSRSSKDLLSTLHPEMSSYQKKMNKITIITTLLSTLVVKRVKIHWQYVWVN